MKKFLFVFLVFPFISNAQIITNWLGRGAGGGTDGLGDGLNKHFARMTNPANVFFDQNGNFYFADQVNQRVRKIDTACIITSRAGTGSGGFNGDGGLADTSELFQPLSVITDSVGNIYIADGVNYRVRKIDHVTGIISTIAGTGVLGYNGDSILAINAQLSGADDLCFDKKGNLLVSDGGNHKIRKINSSGIITTYAGSGAWGCTVNGGRADTSAIGPTTGVCSDTIGNIYISSELEFVYKVDTSGIITIIAGGSGTGIYNGDNMPAINAEINPYKLRVNHAGNLFITDFVNNRIRMIDDSGIIHTAAGSGASAYSGDNGSADSAGIREPGAIGFDACDNLYIAASGAPPANIRKVAFYPSCKDTLCGPHIDTTTAVGKIAANAPIKIYPNPIYDLLHIDNISPTTNYSISNAVGVLLQKGMLGKIDNSVDIHMLAPGIYLLQLFNNGQRVVNKLLKK